MSTSMAHDLQYVIEVARGAGRVIRERYGKVARLTKTHVAADDEAVTEADRESQRVVVAGLKRRWPGDGIVGEESETGTSITAEIPNPMGRVWVIDPIDGTNNFVSGLGNFAVCIGLMEEGRPVLGVVYDVMRDEMYAAARGEGCWLGNRRLSVPQTPLNAVSMIMLTSNLLDKGGRCPEWACKFIGQTALKVRMLGSAALEATMVAAGVAHAAITVNGKLWDCAAPAALVLEAGGVITDLAGNAVFPFDLRNYQGAKVPYLSAAPQAHEAMVEHLRRHP